VLPQEFIRKKRDGLSLTAEEITDFIRGVTDDSVSESQIAAFTMATFLRGMSRDEAVALTLAMRDSGRVLKWDRAQLRGPVVDKHSTGGVGDVVSLMLGPMLAACGCHVPMISGRGLGHTGGTLDKLESILNYQCRLSVEDFQRIVREVGVSIVGQTDELAPADRRIYATRDVTATVESVPLITASILSKKLAAGLDALVMDVKTGSGAFMPTLERSRELAQSIVEVGRGAGMRTSALITDMSQPLAPCAGNAIEVRAAIDYLTGAARPERLHEVTLALCAEALVLSGRCDSHTTARALLQTRLDSGAAAECFARMIAAQGGPSDLLTRPALPAAPVQVAVKARAAGIVTAMDVRAIGLAVVQLGGGRLRSSDHIDPAVGLSEFVALGSHVAAGDALCVVHAQKADHAALAVSALQAAITISDAGIGSASDVPSSTPLVVETLG
jgi:thymidine phosphorylase